MTREQVNAALQAVAFTAIELVEYERAGDTRWARTTRPVMEAAVDAYQEAYEAWEATLEREAA